MLTLGVTFFETKSNDTYRYIAGLASNEPVNDMARQVGWTSGFTLDEITTLTRVNENVAGFKSIRNQIAAWDTSLARGAKVIGMLDTLMEGGNLHTAALYSASAYLRFSREQLEVEKNFYLDPLEGNTVEVGGFVIDQKTRELLNGVKLELCYGSPNGELVATTSILSGGEFGFYDLPFRKGIYYLVYRKDGYDKAVHTFSMTKKSEKYYDCGTCELKPIESTVTPSPTPDVTPTVKPTSTPTVGPTATPKVTPSPVTKPTPQATSTPTTIPTVAPTIEVTSTPVLKPTPQSTPDVEATTVPTTSPTVYSVASPAAM